MHVVVSALQLPHLAFDFWNVYRGVVDEVNVEAAARVINLAKRVAHLAQDNVALVWKVAGVNEVDNRGVLAQVEAVGLGGAPSFARATGRHDRADAFRDDGKGDKCLEDDEEVPETRVEARWQDHVEEDRGGAVGECHPPWCPCGPQSVSILPVFAASEIDSHAYTASETLFKKLKTGDILGDRLVVVEIVSESSQLPFIPSHLLF